MTNSSIDVGLQSKPNITKDMQNRNNFKLGLGNNFAKFYPLGFTNKVLMRHILDGGHSRESVINEHLDVMNDHIHLPSECCMITL